MYNIYKAHIFLIYFSLLRRDDEGHSNFEIHIFLYRDYSVNYVTEIIYFFETEVHYIALADLEFVM